MHIFRIALCTSPFLCFYFLLQTRRQMASGFDGHVSSVTYVSVAASTYRHVIVSGYSPVAGVVIFTLPSSVVANVFARPERGGAGIGGRQDVATGFNGVQRAPLILGGSTEISMFSGALQYRQSHQPRI